MLNKIIKFIKNLFIKEKKVKINPPKHPSEQELSERSKNIKKMYEEEKPKTNDLFVCPTCKINASKIVECKKCGAKGCDLCFTYDASEKGFFCENCW
jgi:hypothetical protein